MKNKIISAITAVALAAIPALSSAANVLAAYTDGSYTASAYGYDGEITATVTISEGQITSITASTEESEPEYFESAVNKVITRIITSQSTDVDAVSGATYSSDAIKSAVSKALSSAYHEESPATGSTPLFRFSARSGTEGVTVNSDGSLTVDPDSIQGDSAAVTVDVFVEERTLEAWYISAKWKSSTQYIQLEDLVDPQYPPTEFAYAETDSTGAIAVQDLLIYKNRDAACNTMGFTCQNNGSSAGVLIPYGQASDSYPFATFDAVISKDISAGDYNIHFLTSAEDYADQRICEVNINSLITVPETVSLDIHVNGELSGLGLGDVNRDFLIDANDSSMILTDYASVSTGGDTSLDEGQLADGDTNGDGLVDAADASNILTYYAYAATTESPISFYSYVKTLE